MGVARGPFRVPLVNQLLSGIPVRQLHTGAFHTHLTTEDSRVFSFGWNEAGQCGVGSQEETIAVPTEVSTLRGRTVLHIASGAMHSHFVTVPREFWSVGSNAFGQLGNNFVEDARKPVLVKLPYASEPVRLLACGDFFTIAIIGDNLAYSWGRNIHCQTGALRSNCVRKPEICLALNRRCEDVVFMTCGSDHTVLLTRDGDVLQFGSNVAKQFGQHLQLERTPAMTPISLAGARIVHVAASGNVTSAVDADGNLHMWGARHTLHTGSRTGLMEHPTAVWKCPERDTRLLRMGRNHLHLLTRNGLLYTWVFANWKNTPSPFLSDTYWKHYTSLATKIEVQTRGRSITNASGKASHSSTALLTPPFQENRVHQMEVSRDMAQLEDLPIAMEASTNQGTEDTLEDIHPYWLEATTTSSGDDHVIAMPDAQRHMSESADEFSDSIEDGNEGDEGATANTSSSPSSTRPTFPPHPWKSFFVGTASVRDIVCGAFSTQLLLFGSRFESEFSSLALRPEQFYADRDLTLSDGSVANVHSFFVRIRCPLLLAKATKRKLLLQAQPLLIRLVIKNLYSSYCYVSELSDDQLKEMAVILRALGMGKSELARCVQAEEAFRLHDARHPDIQRSLVDSSMKVFKEQMKIMYETRIKTDFVVVAGLKPSPWSSQYRKAVEMNDLTSSELEASSIPVHRAILAARSPFFESLFRANFSERTSGSTSLSCDVATLDHLLRYIYYEFTDFSLESAKWILQHSDLVFVDKPKECLQQSCISILRRHGRKVELKAILAILNPELDPYDDTTTVKAKESEGSSSSSSSSSSPPSRRSRTSKSDPSSIPEQDQELEEISPAKTTRKKAGVADPPSSSFDTHIELPPRRKRKMQRIQEATRQKAEEDDEEAQEEGDESSS